jgi:hypothetical protein
MFASEYPRPEEYTLEGLEQKKRQLSAKKGQVTKARNTYQSVKEKLAQMQLAYTRASNDCNEALDAYHKSKEYQEYLRAQAEANTAYKNYQIIQNNVQKLQSQSILLQGEVKVAELNFQKTQRDQDEFEEEFEEYKLNYDRVHNPIIYSDILRGEIENIRKNREQVRNDMKVWMVSAGITLMVSLGLVILIVIYVLTNPSEISDKVIPILGALITGVASGVCFVNYNDAKKRFDNYHEKAENLQRELLGLTPIVKAAETTTASSDGVNSV